MLALRMAQLNERRDRCRRDNDEGADGSKSAPHIKRHRSNVSTMLVDALDVIDLVEDRASPVARSRTMQARSRPIVFKGSNGVHWC